MFNQNPKIQLDTKIKTNILININNYKFSFTVRTK